MKKNVGILFALTALLAVCLLLPCTAAMAEIDLRPFAVGEVSLEQAGISGVLKQQSSFSEGKVSMVVDGDATNWDLAVMLNNAQKEMHIRFEAMPPEHLPLENLWVTVYSGSFKDEQQIRTNLELLNKRYFMQSYAYLHGQKDIIAYHLADYFQDRRLVSPYKHADASSTSPLKNTYVLVWALNHGTVEKPNLEVVAARYLSVDITFTPENTGWPVSFGAVSMPAQQQLLYDGSEWTEEAPVTYESDVMNGQTVVSFDPTADVPEDFWSAVKLKLLFQTPENAAYRLTDSQLLPLGRGTPEEPYLEEIHVWDLFWDPLQQRPASSYLAKEPVILLDENMNVLEESGVYYITVVNEAEDSASQDEAWMEYHLSNTFAKLPATRFDVEIATSAENDVFVCAALPGYTHFMIHPKYEFDLQDMVDLTTDNAAGMPPYSDAFYSISPPSGAKYVSTFIANYNRFRGPQPGTYEQVCSMMQERAKKPVVLGEKVQMFAGHFIEVFDTQYAGVKLACSNMHLAGGDSGRVYFVAWFDGNEKLMKIEWVSEETEPIEFEADVASYSSFSSVPADLTAPALVDFENRGMTLSASFAPQAPQKDAEGYAGYAVQLSLINATNTYDNTEEEELENLYAFLPYYLDADREEDVFKLVRYADGAEEEVAFDTGMSGISFPIKSTDSCTYVLKWKDDPMMKLPADLKEIKPYAFEGSAFTSVRCPNGVESIGEYAFKDSKGLESIYIGSDTQIAENAFDGCTALTLILSDMMGCPAQDLANKLGIEFQMRM